MSERLLIEEREYIIIYIWSAAIEKSPLRIEAIEKRLLSGPLSIRPSKSKAIEKQPLRSKAIKNSYHGAAIEKQGH